MKIFHFVGLLLIFGLLTSIGCRQKPNADGNSQNKEFGPKDDKIKTALAKLNPEDQKLAESQKICPTSKEPLGSMGKPTKITIKDQTIFLCCKSCEKDALANPEKTLAVLKELRAKSQDK